MIVFFLMLFQIQKIKFLHEFADQAKNKKKMKFSIYPARPKYDFAQKDSWRVCVFGNDKADLKNRDPITRNHNIITLNFANLRQVFLFLQE